MFPFKKLFQNSVRRTTTEYAKERMHIRLCVKVCKGACVSACVSAVKRVTPLQPALSTDAKRRLTKFAGAACNHTDVA